MSEEINKIILAPMEGVIDYLMRDILTALNPFDLCITEFVRVVDQLVPKHVFYKITPELHNNGYTSSHTPIRVQLLGQHADWMAENAVRALELGSHGIDVNFGCPAKTVNKSKGGAALLKEPEKIYQIISTIRDAIPQEEKLSVKIRLGFDDTSLFEEIVDAIACANANTLSIHARTKKQGYTAPAYWPFIAKAAENFPSAIIANGEIWTKEDAYECVVQSKTKNVMLGRGILATPNLASSIRGNHDVMSWADLKQLLVTYSEKELNGDKSYYFSSRLKQWLRYIRLQYEEGELLFQAIKLLKSKDEILAILNKH